MMIGVFILYNQHVTKACEDGRIKAIVRCTLSYVEILRVKNGYLYF